MMTRRTRKAEGESPAGRTMIVLEIGDGWALRFGPSLFLWAEGPANTVRWAADVFHEATGVDPFAEYAG